MRQRDHVEVRRWCCHACARADGLGQRRLVEEARDRQLADGDDQLGPADLELALEPRRAVRRSRRPTARGRRPSGSCRESSGTPPPCRRCRGRSPRRRRASANHLNRFLPAVQANGGPAPAPCRPAPARRAAPATAHRSPRRPPACPSRGQRAHAASARSAPRSAPAAPIAERGHAGSCCVMQCSVPSPHTRSTRGCRPRCASGTARPRMPSATRSAGSLNVGTSTTSLRDVEVGVAGRQPLPVERERRAASAAATTSQRAPVGVASRRSSRSRFSAQRGDSSRRARSVSWHSTTTPRRRRSARGRRRGRACRRRRCRGRARPRVSDAEVGRASTASSCRARQLGVARLDRRPAGTPRWSAACRRR